jgi:hypothetical protein
MTDREIISIAARLISDENLSIKAAADRLGVSAKWLHRYVGPTRGCWSRPIGTLSPCTANQLFVPLLSGEAAAPGE